MGYMKELYTELQEEGLKEEEIKKIPDKIAWELVRVKKVRKAKELKEKGIIIKN